MDNGTSVTGESLLPSGTDLLTTANLVFIAILALLTIAAIVYGARLKHRRNAAEKELERYNEEVEQRVDSPPPADALLAADPDRHPDVAARPASTPAEPIAPAPSEPTTRPQPTLADEPIAASAPGEANPAAEAEGSPAVVSPAGHGAADGPVTQIKGLGPKLAEKLAEHGITTVGQIAALDDDRARALDARLGAFTGRMERDRWIEQARFLAAGDRAGFEAVFGRL